MQQDLWGAVRPSTGLRIVWDHDVIYGGGGTLSINPMWHKGDPMKGAYSITLDEEKQELVPELVRTAWSAWLEDPKAGIRPACKRHILSYDRCVDAIRRGKIA